MIGTKRIAIVNFERRINSTISRYYVDINVA